MLPSGVHNTGEITVRMAYSQAPILFAFSFPSRGCSLKPRRFPECCLWFAHFCLSLPA